MSASISRGRLWLSLILLLAAAIRAVAMGRSGYGLDEAWSIEIATGRGSAHQHVPVNVVSPVPPMGQLAGAPPWWQVWSHVEVTHPPLYPLVLRLWMSLFGDGDVSGRALTVVASVAAVGLLFDVLRLQLGVGAAVWGSLLIAIAAPQVQYGYLARSYGLLLAVALAAADAVARAKVLGPTRPRWAALFAAVLATLMTHYFCVGVVLGLAAFAAVQPSVVRRHLLSAIVAAVVVFVVTWGPMMWRQRALFSTADPNTIFLADDSPHHGWATARRAAAVPVVQLLGDRSDSPLLAVVGAVVLIVPLFRRSTWTDFWWLWIAGGLTVVAALDGLRGTRHLIHLRYVILIGPAVFALLPAVARSLRWPNWAAAIMLIISTLAAVAGVGDVLEPTTDDGRLIASKLPGPPGRADLLVFAVPPGTEVSATWRLLRLARYLPPDGPRLVILTGPPDRPTADVIRRARYVYVFAPSDDCRRFVPPSAVVGRNPELDLWTLRFN